MDKTVRRASAQGLELGESAFLPALSQGMECGRGGVPGKRGGHPRTSERRSWRAEALKSVHKLSPVLGQPGAARQKVSPWSSRRRLAGKCTEWRLHRDFSSSPK